MDVRLGMSFAKIFTRTISTKVVNVNLRLSASTVLSVPIIASKSPLFVPDAAFELQKAATDKYRLKVAITEDHKIELVEGSYVEAKVVDPGNSFFVDSLAIQESLSLLNSKFNTLEIEQAELKEDHAVLKEDHAVLKEDNALLKEDHAVLKEDNALLKEYNAVLKEDNAVFKMHFVVQRLYTIGQDLNAVFKYETQSSSAVAKIMREGRNHRNSFSHFVQVPKGGVDFKTYTPPSCGSFDDLPSVIWKVHLIREVFASLAPNTPAFRAFRNKRVKRYITAHYEMLQKNPIPDLPKLSIEQKSSINDSICDLMLDKYLGMKEI